MVKPDQIAQPLTSGFSYGTCLLFCILAATTIIGVPFYGYYIGYTLFDWMHFFVMYIVTGMGITVGYRLSELDKASGFDRGRMGFTELSAGLGCRPYPPSRPHGHGRRSLQCHERILAQPLRLALL